MRPAPLDAPCQELFIRIFKTVVALLVSWQLNFCVSAQDVHPAVKPIARQASPQFGQQHKQ